MTRTQFTIYLENRPGALFGVTCKLAEAHVGVIGISVAGSADVGVAQIVPSDEKKAKHVLDANNFAFTMQDVLVLEVPNQPDALTTGLARLAKAGINVEYVYGTTCSGAGGTCSLILSAKDPEEAERVWARW